ncbi:Multidrug resistance protein MdtA (plasmid) [Sulfitobacter indolifex]|uniref:Multidrug efflux pump, membrane fusion protein (MFP) family n=1 Tax=Sulfitobacter indolifex HEL-45 TaxID=391624 RepID=A0ABP2D660_9RHOB|nr:efflux RND transporter periplasmic adaptor subunit [Sulfitobacter indolifex]EDQ03667.1 multidrug efflux pump, membrane fusion protein (MFP) family [Sulfitobacter indolifex HEL-45]UOA21084.1 Multidrug resistance protein MdtA [Sulfitobacter indolifex]
MKALRQFIVFLLVLVAGLYVMLTYVPASRPFVAQTGVLDLLGIGAAPEKPKASGGGWGGGGPSLVVTAEVGQETLADRITAIGDGRARRSVTVRSNAVGVITELNLPAGQLIEKGAVIALLEDQAEQIALKQAELQLENARTEQVRVERLQNTGAVSQVRLRETELALQSAELALSQAQFDLSQRRILAPISGWVGITDIEEGDRVNAQDELATLTDRSEILIDFRVPERVVAKLALGKEIIVTPLGMRDLTLKGEVSAIDSVIDRASRTLLVQGRVPNEDDQLRAGMAFSVSLTFVGDALLAIPPLAVQWSSDGPFVWAVREGKAQQVAVEIAQRNSDSVLVLSEELAATDVVVTEGVQTLREGGDVREANQSGSVQSDAASPEKKSL